MTRYRSSAVGGGYGVGAPPLVRGCLLVLAAAVCLGGCRVAAEDGPDYVDGILASPAPGTINVVVEIPGGTNDKWEVDKTSGTLEWEQLDGRPRVVQYLSYPGNYGMVPRTSLPSELGGDGDPLDVLLLGPRVERGAVVRARPIGVLRLVDDGERDDKILAVQSTGPLSGIGDLETLEADYPGVLLIVKTWFANYKGAGRVEPGELGDVDVALAIVDEASSYYESSADERRPSASHSPEVDALLAEWDRPDSPGAVVGVFHNGEIVHARGYGAANLDHGIPLTPRSVLRVGSISKQFVAMGIALLAEEQQLALGDDIRAYLPEMPDYGSPITIRHLLHHTSGIREYLALVGLIGKREGGVHGYTSREILSLLSRQAALNFEPGERFSYSNSGYFLLAEIIARVSGMKASAFAQQRIFGPLGMTSSRLYDDPTAIVPGLAYGYSRRPDAGYRLDILRSDVIGDLGVVSTVEDFLRWDENFYANVLGTGGRGLVGTLLERGRTTDGEQLSYAGGLEWGDYRGLITVEHSGSAVGYVADYLRFPDERFSVIVLSNFSDFRPGRLARRIADVYLAERFTEGLPPARGPRSDSITAPPVVLSTRQLEELAGHFYSDELEFTYSFEVRDGDLELDLRGRRIVLVPESEARFRGDRIVLEFERNSEDAVSGLVVQVGEVRGIRFDRVEGRRPRPVAQ